MILWSFTFIVILVNELHPFTFIVIIVKFDKQWPPYKILERVKVGKWKRIVFVCIFITFFGGGGGVK